MCDPVSMTVVAAAGAGTSLIGSGIAAKDAYDQGQEEGKALDVNASRARMMARDATQRGQVEAGQARQEGSEVIAEQRLATGSSGFDPGVGTPVELMADTRAAAEQNAQRAANDAAREAWGLNQQSVDLRNQANRARSAGKKRAAATLLGGISSAAASGAKLGGG